VSNPKQRVAILGGGMAGLATAWRLSEPGWQNRLESITLYQRGWRLGGKGASSRGRHDRIEEHGLHIWLGSYENAFALLRECYDELDRTTTDPDVPIRDWREAMVPADNLGLADPAGDDWLTWQGTFARNDLSPGDPAGTGRAMSVPNFLERAAQLLLDFVDSNGGPSGLVLSTSQTPPRPESDTVTVLIRAATAALLTVGRSGVTDLSADQVLRDALTAIRGELDYAGRADQRRGWLLVSMVVAVVRGILADNLVTDPRGFRAIDDEDFGQWILRHGSDPDVLEYPLIRGVYDLVFGYRDGDPDRPSFSAGLMIFLIGAVLFEYKGAIFWKMTAGMGDIVIAPIYQALRNRGVEFEFFHRLDGLHLDARRQAVEAISLGRQTQLADGLRHYEPLLKVKGLPVFPDAPLDGQLAEPVGRQPRLRDLESHFCAHQDVERRVLRRGVDFDQVVLAVSLGMVPTVAAELIADNPDWRDMVDEVKTVATQSFQLWLRPNEPQLGWDSPGVTVSGYQRPFETWASMPQTLWAENWPDTDQPGTVAYFCGSLDAPWPPGRDVDDYLRAVEAQVHSEAADHVDRHLRLFFPHAFDADGFDWNLLAGNDGARGVAALAGQHVSVNIDPSDRYVQSVPGSDRYRLRADESGYDNLVLAGDWTDCGMNAGCIEAAVMSGLQAANALLGRGRFHRIRGYWLP